MRLTFRTWTHGLGTTAEDTLEGETLGEIIDRAIEMSRLDQGDVSGVKLDIDGHVVRMRRVEDKGGDVDA